MSEAILPLGSVVRLIGAENVAVMVIGYEPIAGDVTADYLGVIYPEGLVSEDAVVAFDAGMVAEVSFEGFLDDAGREGFAAVKRYRELSAEALESVNQLIESISPETVVRLVDAMPPTIEMPEGFEVPEGYVDLPF